MQLESLESRVMLAGTATQLLTSSILPSPYTSVGASPSTPIIVAVADATGATVTTDNTTVVMLTLITNPAGGSLTQNNVARGSITATAASGIATFSNFSFSVPGQYSLNIFDSKGALAGTQSYLFTVLAMATHLVFNVQPGNITAGTAFSPAVQVYVEDATGALVTTDTRAISLALGSTTGTLTGGTVTNAVGGIATFTGVSETKAGNFTLQAKDASSGGTLTAASSISFAVASGPAARLVFEQQPTNTPLGESFGTIVDVTDSLGNLVISDTSTVTLTVATPSGTPLGGATAVAVSNGKAVFTGLFIGQPGDYTLQAADTSSGLTAALSANFAIIGSPSKLAFIGRPAQTTIGHTMSPGVVVAVEDDGNHIVINDTSSIMLTVVGPGSMSGTTTVQVVNGLATFTDLSFSAMGTYTLVASDGLLTGATSSSFIINGTAAQLAFLVQPTAPSSNTVIVPPIVVVVEDTAGNRVVDDTSTVVISMASGPGVLSGVTQVAAVNGTASFSSLKLSLAGTYTLEAAGVSGNLAIAQTDPFVVLQAASRVVFATQPSDVASGATMYPAVTVQIQNDAGQVATTNTSSVTLVILDGPDNGTIGGSITVTAVAGVATFSNLTFGVTGQYTLVAYDGTLAADTSNPFTVTTPPTKLQWGLQPILSITAGQSLPQLLVEVMNRNSELVDSNHSTVTVSISSGPTGGSMTLGGTVAANATASTLNGIATFNNLSFTKAGTYILSAADGNLKAAKTKKIVVSPDTASAHLVVGSSPTTALVGRTLASNVVINVADRFGNIIWDNSPITLFISNGTGGILTGSTLVSAKKGVANFGNLAISQAGSYVITASDTALVDATPATFSLTVTPVISTVNKPATASSYAAGKDFTLTTQLRGVASSAAPWTGDISLVTNSGVVLPATAQVTTGGKVTLAVAGQTAGTYTVRVKYAGDVNHLGGASQAFSLVVGGSTKTTVSPTVVGTTLSLNVQVAGSGATKPSGSVQLLENSVVIAAENLDGSSHALFTFTPTIGSHTYTVAYPGDSNFRSSVSSAVTVAIGLASSTTVTPSATQLGVGDTLNLNVQVGPGTGSATPSGNVQLLENGTVNRTLALDGSAQALFEFKPTLGKHAYTVAYQGDSSFLTSTSRTINVTVGREATTVALTPSAASIIFGTTFTLGAQVSAANGTAIARTGTVALKDGGTIIATQSLNGSSSATFTLVPTAGTHAYSVAYLGDGNFVASTSAAQVLTVAQDTTAISSAGGSGTIFGIFVFVQPVHATASIPTGVVQLQDHGVTIMTLTLDSAGQGTFYLTPPAGDHSYTWIYLGDNNFASSVSASPLVLTEP
jgi:hypothetical protein